MIESSGARRRGDVLNDAILTAAWDELVERGFAGLTLDNVAKRAGTSRPVLSRRWAGRADIAVATIDHYRARHPIIVTDMGNLRGELASFLRQLSIRGAPTADVILFGMEDYFQATASNYAGLRDKLRGQEPLDAIFERAILRGDIAADKLTPRIRALASDLVRHETFKTRSPPSDDAIFDIIDSIVLPLLSPASRG